MKILKEILFTVLCGMSFGAFGHYAFSLSQWDVAIAWLLVFMLLITHMFAEYRIKTVTMQRDIAMKQTDDLMAIVDGQIKYMQTSTEELKAVSDKLREPTHPPTDQSR